jgi:hypothetical protein
MSVDTLPPAHIMASIHPVTLVLSVLEGAA